MMRNDYGATAKDQSNQERSIPRPWSNCYVHRPRGARSARADARLCTSSGINLIVPLSFHVHRPVAVGRLLLLQCDGGEMTMMRNDYDARCLI